MQKIIQKNKAEPIFTLAEIALVLVISGLIAGIALVGITMMESSKVRSQVSQIEELDSAVSTFFDKYQGMPGDLLSVQADRYGLEHGDGTPSHGDGDGKISPCNLGWQWSLGCETALFWDHLSTAGLISNNFSADRRFKDNRLDKVGVMNPYIPSSPIADGLYIAIWNSDKSQPSPETQLPYGNYYEISKIEGVVKGKMIDNANALTPSQAQTMDAKIDDGIPFAGRVVVNGEAHWPDDAWGSYAHTSKTSCVNPDHEYNVYEGGYAKRHLCHLAIALTCCEPEKD